MTWSLTTNAVLLADYLDDILAYQCSSINVSLHGTSAQHDAITGVSGAFKRAVDAIIALDQMKEHHHQKTPLIALNCVITNDNVTHLRDILTTLQSLPVSSITFSHLHFSRIDFKRHPTSTVNSQTIDSAKLEDLTDFLVYLEHAKLPIKTFTYPIINERDVSGYYADTGYHFNNSCVFPWLTADVYPNGNVQLCNQSIGSLETHSLKSIINSRRALAFKKWVKHGKRDLILEPPDCFRCPHRHYY